MWRVDFLFERTVIMNSSRDISASSSAQFRARSNVVGSNRRLYSPMSESTRREHSLTVSTDSRFGLQPGGHLPAPQSVFKRVRMLVIVVFGLYCTIKFTLDMVLHGLGPSPPRKEDQSVVSPLDALPQSFRLSRLADLHNPHDFQPFSVHPTFIDPLALNITACVCITPLELDQVVTAANGWPGFLSIAFVYPSPLSKSKRRRLQSRLKSLAHSSKLKRRTTIHTYSISEHVSPPCNSLLNLARFFAQTPTVLLTPSVLTLEALGQDIERLKTFESSSPSLPIFLVERSEEDETSITQSTKSGGIDFLPSTALVLDRDSGPWCPERFLSSPQTQWLQCLWFAWLQSLGEHRLAVYRGRRSSRRDNGENVPPKSLEDLAPSILERIDELLVPKFRSEACIHLSRNLEALRGGESSPGSLLVTQKQWLRDACPEAVEIWGEAFFF